jgi:hypothetical protein
MKKEIKNFFLTFIKLNKKKLILALLFFLVFGLIFPSQKTWAQIEGFSLNCGWADAICAALEGLLSGILKIVILIFFGIPLLISALFVGIMSLILGWIISPDFISLKFTQNPFVNIGLSITRNFANMGFIIFLVAIALATALRIEEYKAKKTLITLILIALLVNFSPVLCGFIIDASNIVMNFFLNHVTGLIGFYNFVMGAAQALWNLIVTSGFNLWANISAAMQIIIMIVFNYFAGFIFILFSALFIMRYIMLWILVILSPIAFVSYILPITRRGQSLLSWRKWWEQLVAWSIIGIIAAFFLYLGFTMIAMINANPREFVCLPGDQNCGPGGLGLMNNILPYLIPLVLLWIAYRETKRTSAMFAREIIEMPEKVAKGAVMAAAIASTGVAATAMAGKLKKATGTLSSEGKFEKWRESHPIAGKLATPIARPMQWARQRVEKGVPEEVKEKGFIPTVKEKIAKPIRPVKEKIEEYAEEHPKFKEFKGYAEAAGKGLKTTLWEKPKQEVTGGFREAWEEWKKRSGYVAPLAKEREIEKLRELRRRLEAGEKISEEEWREYEEIIREVREERERGGTPSLRDVEKWLGEREREIERERTKETLKRPKKEKLEVEKMEPEEFRKKIRPEELRDINIFYKASPSQIQIIEKRGTEDQKEALRELGRSMTDEILKKIEDSVAKNKLKEAEDLNEKFKSLERIKKEAEKKTK